MSYNFRSQINSNVSIGIDRFNSNIYKTDSCWIWTASKDRTGYGCFTVLINNKKKSRKSHRIAYALNNQRYDLIEEYNPSIVIHHKCNNKLCCNPTHLELTDTRGNSNYAVKDGLILTGEKCKNSKLTNAQVHTIKTDIRPDQYYATLFNVSVSLIQKIRLGTARRHG